MRTEELERAILKVLKNNEFHGYEAQKRLVAEGVNIEIARLYMILNEMVMRNML